MNKTIKIERTNILPLRWFANMLGEVAGWSISCASYLDEKEDYGWKYKMHSLIWKFTWPTYSNYGTFYQWVGDLGGSGWDDYDENGHPYWYFTEWQEDPETGDGWRLVRKQDAI